MGNESERSSINPLEDVIRGKQGSDGSDGVKFATNGPIPRTDLTAAVGVIGDAKGSLGGNGLGNQAASSDAGRMEAVVDLLFGSHLNDINTNLRNLEKQFSRRIDKMEEEIRLRMESIDRQTKAEMDSLGKLIEKERSGREEEMKKVGDQMEAAARQIGLRLEEMESEFTSTCEAAQKDFEVRIGKAAETTTLLRLSMEKEIAGMKASLSTRAELGAMFGELGKRLEANAGGGGQG